MKKKWIAAIVTLLLLVATYGMLLAYFTLGKEEAPVARGGTLDLQQWNFARDGIVRLDGEWAFYPGRLLEARHAGTTDGDGDLIRVPGSWASNMETLGAATYRLRVWMPETDEVFGLKTSTIQLSSRVIVNGNVVGSSGDPADKSHRSALIKPYVSYFNMQPGWNEIWVHAANYHFSASGGIVESIAFGTAAQIAALRDKALAHDLISLSALLIMGFYFIGLYAQRRKDLSLLVFSLVCVCVALFMSTRGERLLLAIAGDIPFWLYFRIQMVSAVGIGLVFFLYVYTAFRAYCSKWLVRGGIGAGLLFVVLHAGFATELTTALFRQLSSLYATLPILYATYVFVLAALHKVEGSRYLVIVASALNALALKQNLNVYFGMPIYSLPPFEPFLVMMMLALLMSLRFSNAFHKIEDLSERLIKADKLKDDFLARTSHEFKTPLHGIMNISRSMLEETIPPPTEEQREKLQLISGITRRLSQLVYDILDLSKLKQGELHIAPKPIDVRSVVEAQMGIYGYLSKERNLGLVNQVPLGLPPALADESRLSQIIGNLLDNAIKYTKSGGVVVTGAERNGMIEIAVQDTGEGIAEEHVSLIFEPFKSLDGFSRHGFGLGLSIARQLAELQHGSLSVASTPGVGSVFCVALPVAEAQPESVHSGEGQPLREPEYSFATPYDSNRDGKHTVLIVDDQPVNLKVLLDALATLDYRVIAVKNGAEALEQLNRPLRLDLVILDVMMPGMSGYEVCREIRKRYSLLELPVLMVTAAIQQQDKVAAFQAGANDYLPKPFDLEELRARIGSLLALRGALAQIVRLEVAFLYSQIKPHFLYNVLNSIAASSYTDAERSRKMLADLADYLRGSFNFSNTEGRIGLSEEFKLIRTYVAIEQARFKDRIRVHWQVDEGADQLPIPPLLLQPLVENAIRHGIGGRIDGGTVTLTATRSEAGWLLTVEDDGVGIEPELLNRLLNGHGAEKLQGVGLLNINKRLFYEYGVGLDIESEPGVGVKVSIRLPHEEG